MEERQTHQHSRTTEIAHAALRGAVAAMSMSGLRALTTRLGLIARTPPEVVTEEGGPDVLRRLTRRQREGLIILLHWAYGAGGGAVFGALPDRVRLKPWAGPAYGTAVWLGFELGILPVLGLRLLRQQSTRERLALAADHLLYGAVLSELRARPRDTAG
ncbi:hypothetical protein B0I33_101160 [Prauserella shujinwangii]|uniref:DUF1440 domain-containing protein n=1 Tax=Prauserella shujinwangii TaxID=1453103 RepID=A0A2T0M2P0_9PSEU|nr:hypothetical protein [Prauserella shujinwangii]PRX51008.1 hypothetical protein B0I33_101160 [Prauserella shujinwangii]